MAPPCRAWGELVAESSSGSPASLDVAELRAVQSIDVRGLRSLEETIHLSFDVDGPGTVWMYQFGWLQRREESQIFRIDAERRETRVFPIPSALQRLPFAVFCAAAGRLFLLGCPAATPVMPNGFALDTVGRIVAGFHLRVALLDAVADTDATLWLAGVEAGAAGGRRVVLQRLGLDGQVLQALPAKDWAVGQLTCLACPDGRLLVGGTDARGATRIEVLQDDRLVPLLCGNIGQPLSLGFDPQGELLCLAATGRLVRVAAGVATDLRLRDPENRYAPRPGRGALRLSARVCPVHQARPDLGIQRLKPGLPARSAMDTPSRLLLFDIDGISRPQGRNGFRRTASRVRAPPRAG